MYGELPLFVYGTLMSGHQQAALLTGRKRSTATIRGTLYSLPAGYPALTLGSSGLVHGELVHDLDSRLLRLLDQYEGGSEGLYQRCAAEVTVGLKRVKAWVYVMDRPDRQGGRVVKSGRWRRVRQR